MRLRWLIAALVWLGCFGAQAEPARRVVSLGGSVTEIVYGLGQGARLVADDASSLYPEAATRLPRIGYYRAVPVEGVISMRPDLVLASENAGPPQAMKSLSELGVAVRVVSDAPSLESLYRRIMQIAQELGVPEEGARLLERVRQDVAGALGVPATPRRALLLLNRGGQWTGAGRGTVAGAIMALAGLENGLAAQKGYRPVSAEGLALLAPEMIVVTAASVRAGGGLEKFRASPGVSSTPAARNDRIVVMDDLLILGMGPRVGQAIRQLKESAK